MNIPDFYARNQAALNTYETELAEEADKADVKYIRTGFVSGILHIKDLLLPEILKTWPKFVLLPACGN